MSTALARIGASEAQSMAIASASPVPLYPGLRRALAEFRLLWGEGMPMRLHERADQVEPDDHLGGPAMTERWKRWLLSDDGPRTPVRRALAEMAAGSLSDRVGSRYLFALACRDFDPRAAALSMTPPLMPEYVPLYAERVIGRALEVIDQLGRGVRGRRDVYRPCATAGCGLLTAHEHCEEHRRVV